MGATANDVRACLERFRAINPDMPLSHMLVLLEVAGRPGLLQSEVEQRTALAQSRVSRALKVLGDGLGRKGGPTVKAYGLVAVEEDGADRRNRRLYLTEEGSGFMAQAFGDAEERAPAPPAGWTINGGECLV